MGSLLDIAAAPVSIEIGSAKVDVFGLSAKGIAYLMQRFPDVREAMLGKGLDLTPELILSLGPDLGSAIIAAGCGSVGDAKAEAAAANLALGHQVDLLAAIITATLPGGTKKVFDRLETAAAAAGLSLTPSQTPPPTSSPEAT